MILASWFQTALTRLEEWFWYPWILPAVLLLPLLAWAWSRRLVRPAIRFSGTDRLRSIVGHAPGWPRRRLLALRLSVILLLIVCIARPRKADEETRIKTEGIAIQLVLDRSGSMDERDFVTTRNQLERRIDAVKRAVRVFIEGDADELQGRPNDLIGLVAFGTFADSECPMTRDHRHLLRALAKIEPFDTPEEAKTAIGDALLLAVERIRDVGRRFSADPNFKIKSRVLILLTDGQQTAGKHTPLEAAEVAAALGMKVYTIGAAPDFQERRAFGFSQSPTIKVPVSIDEETLKKVAEKTGGKFFRARDEASLREIYAEIDKLERSVIDETRYYRYEELGSQWLTLGDLRLPPFLLVGLLLVFAEVLLISTRLRRIP